MAKANQYNCTLKDVEEKVATSFAIVQMLLPLGVATPCVASSSCFWCRSNKHFIDFSPLFFLFFFFCFKVECEFALGFLGGRTSRALTFIANFFLFVLLYFRLLWRPNSQLSIRRCSSLAGHLGGQCPCCTFPNRLQTGYALRKRV